MLLSPSRFKAGTALPAMGESPPPRPPPAAAVPVLAERDGDREGEEGRGALGGRDLTEPGLPGLRLDDEKGEEDE